MTTTRWCNKCQVRGCHHSQTDDGAVTTLTRESAPSSPMDEQIEQFAQAMWMARATKHVRPMKPHERHTFRYYARLALLVGIQTGRAS